MFGLVGCSFAFSTSLVVQWKPPPTDNGEKVTAYELAVLRDTRVSDWDLLGLFAVEDLAPQHTVQENESSSVGARNSQSSNNNGGDDEATVEEEEEEEEDQAGQSSSTNQSPAKEQGATEKSVVGGGVGAGGDSTLTPVAEATAGAVEVTHTLEQTNAVDGQPVDTEGAVADNAGNKNDVDDDAASAQTLMLACLLYTSPSPRDRG